MKKARLDNEDLIALVEKHPLLYNPLLKNYRNKQVRLVTWQKIAAMLGVDSEMCQKRWRQLRDRYKKEIQGTIVKKNDAPWEYYSMMSFLNESCYPEHSDVWKKKPAPVPVIQPFTSHPVIITVPTSKNQTRTLRPIAPKITIEETITPDSAKSSESMDFEENLNSFAGDSSEEQTSNEREIYLVTPTLFNDQERTLYKNSISSPKRKATSSIEAEEAMADGARAKRAAIEEETALRRQEFECKMKWEEKEHLLRMECQEDEHKVRMQVERARLKVEEENLKIKEQKLRVLLAKEAYFKSLIKTEE